MTRRATKTPRARRDLVEIAAYLGEHNEDAARRFLHAAAQAFVKLAEFPGIGTKREFARPELAAVRSWPIAGFANYLIFYVPTRRGIRVLRVVHGARDLRRLFEPPE